MKTVIKNFKIDNHYVSKLYDTNNNGKLENKEISVWLKDNNYNISNGKVIKNPTASNKEIITNINSSSKLFGNSKTLTKYTNMINVNNAIKIVQEFKNTYGYSIFNAIMRDVFMSSNIKEKALKHINNMLMKAMKLKGIYTDDYNKLINGHIEYEKKKLGKMKSKDIDQDLRGLFDRYNHTINKKNETHEANGKIDKEFKQGDYVQDCWLIAPIKSLAKNPKGQELLGQIISTDKKGDIIVKLKGVNKKYIITKDELRGANEFSQGDLDVRAIEIAINRYLHEIGDHENFFTKYKNKLNGVKIRNTCYDIYDGMAGLSIPYYLLFGKQVKSNEYPNKDLINKITTGNYSAVVASQNNYKIDSLKKFHVYAVLNADKKFVYIQDPYNTNSEPYEITHDEFLKFFSQSYITEL